LEASDLVSERSQNATNLTFKSLRQDDPDLLPAHLDDRIESCAALCKVHPLFRFRSVGRIKFPVERDEVFLFEFVFRMGDPKGQLAVVGEQEESLGLFVKPADVRKPR